MNGWIIRTDDTTAALQGDILGSDGKTYCFYADDPAGDMGRIKLCLPSAVSFVPGEQRGLYPTAISVRPDDSGPIEELGSIQSELRARLSEKRWMHCFRVAKTARALAAKTDCSPDKAEMAAWLHDNAKELPREENVRIILESGMPVSSFELQYHHITHAAAGAVLAEKEFGIHDSEILNAIRYHNGRPAMGTLEKIIFLADHMDNGYKQCVNLNFIVDAPDIDDAMYKSIAELNRYYVRHREQPDVITECTMNYMFRRPGGISPGEDSSFIPDELFDSAMDINLRHSTGLRSVSNSRELGGYRGYDGRRILSGRLVRSARLSDMTPEDAVRLRGLGIDTVIDLRSPEEIREHPDRNTELFRCISCPLPTLELSDYQKNVAEKFTITADSREKTFYLSEYLSCISMENMYMDILTDPSSAAQLRRVFHILLEEDCGGVLFHCTSGKDRTGIVAALVMSALGVRTEDIRRDYYASAVPTFSVTEAFAQNLRRQRYSPAYIREMRYYSGIGMNIAENTYGTLLAEYGSVGSYLSRALGLSDETLAALREKYLASREET